MLYIYTHCLWSRLIGGQPTNGWTNKRTDEVTENSHASPAHTLYLVAGGILMVLLKKNISSELGMRKDEPKNILHIRIRSTPQASGIVRQLWIKG